MRLENLQLRDFRNYVNLDLEFAPGVNLIVGDNAQGKTNLLEAIAFLGTGKSFRAQKNAEMVRFEAEFADITGDLFSQERDQSLRWVLFRGAKPRQLYHNGVKKKAAGEIAGVLPAVLFCDLSILSIAAKDTSALATRFLISAVIAFFAFSASASFFALCLSLIALPSAMMEGTSVVIRVAAMLMMM